jgi:uncharacterized SAM-binding protein YcdF (DUF218 family)
MTVPAAKQLSVPHSEREEAKTSPQRSRALRYGATLLFATMLLAGAYFPTLRAIGSFLIIEDSLQPAQAIVALAGQTPFREMEAAKLYLAGWAPLIILVRGAHSEEERALQDMGIAVGEGWEVSYQVLVRQGVPASAILVPRAETGGGTLEELQTVALALRSKDTPVILVTSKYHARRTRLTWNHLTEGRSQGIVRSASRDPFDPTRWWRERRFVLAVVREYLGLVNYYAGFPIGTGADGR